MIDNQYAPIYRNSQKSTVPHHFTLLCTLQVLYTVQCTVHKYQFLVNTIVLMLSQLFDFLYIYAVSYELYLRCYCNTTVYLFGRKKTFFLKAFINLLQTKFVKTDQYHCLVRCTDKFWQRIDVTRVLRVYTIQQCIEEG